MIEKIQKMTGPMRFFTAMVILYLITSFFAPVFVLTVFQKFLGTFLHLLPILFFVWGVVFIINIFLQPEKIKKHLGHDSGLKGWIYAIIASVLIISPPYVIFPLLGELKRHGMKPSLMTVFLGNRNVQPAFLPVMAYYFGLPYTIIISIYILSFSILSGILMGRIMQE